MNELASRKGKDIATVVIVSLLVAATLILPVVHLIDATTPKSTPLYEPRVLAFYYTWYGNQTEYFGEHPHTSASIFHWSESHPDLDPPIVHDPLSDPFDIASANTPTLGGDNITMYDSCDPDAIKYHLELASTAGIDSFIATWWGQGAPSDYNFVQLLNVTEMEGSPITHTIYFETCQERYGNSEGHDGITEIYDDITYVLERYSNHSRFLKIYDETMGIERPVIFLYAITCKPTVANWAVAVQWLRGNGSYPFLIADIGGAKTVPQDVLAIFDGIHVYNPYSLYLNSPGQALGPFRNMIESSRAAGLLSTATVLPGYDDTQVRHGNEPLKRLGGDVYDYSWEIAKMANPDWVLICSFNEWHEGSEIETSMEYGTLYIDKTADHALGFKS